MFLLLLFVVVVVLGVIDFCIGFFCVSFNDDCFVFFDFFVIVLFVVVILLVLVSFNFIFLIRDDDFFLFLGLVFLGVISFDDG